MTKTRKNNSDLKVQWYSLKKMIDEKLGTYYGNKRAQNEKSQATPNLDVFKCTSTHQTDRVYFR